MSGKVITSAAVTNRLDDSISKAAVLSAGRATSGLPFFCKSQGELCVRGGSRRLRN
jgi:hypothetical protein